MPKNNEAAGAGVGDDFQQSEYDPGTCSCDLRKTHKYVQRRSVSFWFFKTSGKNGFPTKGRADGEIYKEDYYNTTSSGSSEKKHYRLVTMAEKKLVWINPRSML